METYVKERFYAQHLTLPVFISLAFTFDLTMHMAEGTELGFFTLWIGTIVPFTSVLLFATMPTLVTKTRSVVRDLLGVFSGTTLFWRSRLYSFVAFGADGKWGCSGQRSFRVYVVAHFGNAGCRGLRTFIGNH